MQVLEILNKTTWSTIQSVLLLDLDSTKKVIVKCYEDFTSNKKQLHEFSPQVQIALEIYIDNKELLDA